jgi:hypothetical protein
MISKIELITFLAQGFALTSQAVLAGKKLKTKTKIKIQSVLLLCASVCFVSIGILTSNKGLIYPQIVWVYLAIKTIVSNI